MARLESIAVAGFYKTPRHLVPHIARRLSVAEGVCYSYLDPCAGEGEALGDIVKILSGSVSALPATDNARGRNSYATDHLWSAYCVEMESSRAESIRGKIPLTHDKIQVLVGDSFSVSFSCEDRHAGVQVLYLNPPYDTDPETSRLEEKFLQRWTRALCPDGVLVYIVPYYALSASADTLATHYRDLTIARFPQSDFEFSQVVVYGTKRAEPLPSPDPMTLSKVMEWSRSADPLPSITDANLERSYALPCLVRAEAGVMPSYVRGWAPLPDGIHLPGLDQFVMLPLDMESIQRHFLPWHTSPSYRDTPKPHAKVLPDSSLASLWTRTYPMVLPPKPAHIAAGIAAGAFNGETLHPDDPNSGLPDLLVKGVFTREFRTTEEKTDKHGDVVSVTQVQSPSLVVTALDLRSYRLYTLKSTVESTLTFEGGKPLMDTISTGDLLTHYGQSLLWVLRKHCPILHDPTDATHEIPLVDTKLPLFSAQKQAVMGAVKVLGGPGVPLQKRKGKAVVILGEIGSGKTPMSLVTALTAGARRMLVLCPPHLIQEWPEQVDKFTPWVETHVISSFEDLSRFRASKADHAIAILSRETAKLGHSWVSISPQLGRDGVYCPKCANPVPKKDTLAEKRARCGYQAWIPLSDRSKILHKYGPSLLLALPGNPILTPLVSSPMVQKMNRKKCPWLALEDKPSKSKSGSKSNRQATEEPTLQERAGKSDQKVALNPTITPEIQRFKRLPDISAMMMDLSEATKTSCYVDYKIHLNLVKALVHLASFVDDEDLILKAIRVLGPSNCKPLFGLLKSYSSLPEDLKSPSYASLFMERDLSAASDRECVWDWNLRIRPDGVKLYHNVPLGGSESLSEVVEMMWSPKEWSSAPSCGEPLYQGSRSPDRYPLATYISRYARDTFDFLILDEGHEYSSEGSAQERAAHRLTEIGAPTILLTGSLMSGYASSLFQNWWSLFPSFRQEFDRNQKQAYVDRYGYRKRVLQFNTEVSVRSHGSMSDRVEYVERDAGMAPGILPVFVLQMLKYCVAVHKTDLEIELPPCREIPVLIEPTPDQRRSHGLLVSKVLETIKKDRYTERSGKLMGALTEIPSHLDRCTPDVGNTEEGVYRVCYPDGVLVAEADPVLETILPKEVELLRTLDSEIQEGRRMLILAWHTSVVNRLAKILRSHLGPKEPIPVLNPSKVPTNVRKSWIQAKVVDVGAKVLLTNPVCVSTGINNLVHFSSEWWHENPACNPIIYRQTIGRIDRIGQKASETRVYVPVYEGTVQERYRQLLLHKVAVSLATDGLDATSALQAAGVGDTNFSGLTIGRELYKILTENE